LSVDLARVGSTCDPFKGDQQGLRQRVSVEKSITPQGKEKK